MKDKFIKLTTLEGKQFHVRKKLICYFCESSDTKQSFTTVNIIKGKSSFSVKETVNDIDFVLNEE